MSETDSSGDERHAATRRATSAATTVAVDAGAAAIAAANAAAATIAAGVQAGNSADTAAATPVAPSLAALPLDDPDDFVPGIHTRYMVTLYMVLLLLHAFKQYYSAYAFLQCYCVRRQQLQS
jgi:hypothetical protein